METQIRRRRTRRLFWVSPNGGGGTLIFSYIRRLGSLFRVQNLNFYIFKSFEKNKYFLGYEEFVDIFCGGGGGHHKIGLC